MFILDSSNLNIYGNTANNNDRGFTLTRLVNSEFHENTADSNEQYGVFVEGVPGFVTSDNSILDNMITNNVLYGLKIFDSARTSVSGNTITGNTDGIYVESADSTSINNNNVCENSNSDINVDTSSTGTSGDDNTCGTTEGYDDTGTTGCTNACGVTACKDWEVFINGYCQCIGDCNGDGSVTESERDQALLILEESAELSTCAAADANGDESVKGNEITLIVNNMVRTDCPAAGGSCTPETETFSPQSEKAELLLVIDRSNSMDEIVEGTETRLDLIKTATTNMVDNFQNELAFGLLRFPKLSFLRGCDVEDVYVDIADDNIDQIKSRINSMSTTGGTPTAATLGVAYDYLVARGSTRPQAVLLATDGAPNCNDGHPVPCECSGLSLDFCPVPDDRPDLCLDDANTYQAARDLADQDIPVYVIGVPGTEVFCRYSFESNCSSWWNR